MICEWTMYTDTQWHLTIDGRHAATATTVPGGWRTVVIGGLGAGFDLPGVVDFDTARDIAEAAHDLPVTRCYRVALGELGWMIGNADALRWWIFFQTKGQNPDLQVLLDEA